MQGYTTDYVNLIADNLRDRYESGFPILKELIQNADDAKARTLIFGTHPGFPDASNPLLKSSGLWCFNDGEFKESDVEDLRSFGINSKAGDASAIGKFGLGMKSVFHLCEAMFYVACDGTGIHREGLTPWKQGDRMPHPEWDETSGADWQQGVPPKLIIFNGFLVGAGAQHCQGQIRQRDRFATTVTIPTRNGDFGATRAGSEWPAPRAHSTACPNA